MPATTAAEIIRRARAVPLRSVYYHQYGTGFGIPPDWRPDCSGACSYALGISPPGLSTVTLPQSAGGPLVPITWAQLRPGDFLMRGGAGTGGSSGHVGLCLEIWADGRIVIWEQGGGWGPTITAYTQLTLISRNMKPYRSIYTMTSEGVTIMYCQYGDGMNGQPPSEVVKGLQRRIEAAGGSVGTSGADGEYGNGTAAGLVQVIGAAIAGDGHSYEADQLAALDVAIARRQLITHKHPFAGTTGEAAP